MTRGKRAVFKNNFGSVYGDRVSFNIRPSLLGNTQVKELQIQDIKSVEHKTSRNIAAGILGSIISMLALIGLVFEMISVQSITVFYLFVAGLAVISLIQLGSMMALVGWAEVTINPAVGRMQTSIGAPSMLWVAHHHAAQDFVAAVRKAMPDGG